MRGNIIANYDARFRRGQDLRTLVLGLWRHRKLIIIGACLGLSVAVIYLHLAARTYTISLEVAAVQQASISGTGLSTLSSLAGLSTSSTANAFDLYKEAVQSPLVAQVLAQRRPDVLHFMFASQWSEKDRQWRAPRGILHALKVGAYTVLGIPQETWHAPDARDVRDFLTGNLRTTEPRDSPTIILILDSTNPASAGNILLTVHEIADGQLRQRALARATGDVNYALGELSKTSVVEYREALLEQLEEAEHRRMLAATGFAYAADTMGSPIVSSSPTNPHGVLVLTFFTILGGFLGFLAAIVRVHFFDVATSTEPAGNEVSGEER